MKKYIAAGLALLCLTGCGKGAKTDISYTLANTDEQTEIVRRLDLLQCKAIIERGYKKEELPEAESFTDEEIKNTDVKKELSKMEDISDDILYEDMGVKVYSVKEDPSFMVTYNDSFIYLSNEVYARTEEYSDFVDEVTKNSGLLYNGTVLGRFAPNKDDDLYTGRNMIAFANEEYIQSDAMDIHMDEPSGKRIYNDIPIRAEFYMDGEDIGYLQIYMLSGTAAPVLTEKNLKQLSFGGVLGDTAAKAAKTVFGAQTKKKGEINGIKYTYYPNVSDGILDMRYSVLELKL